MARTPAPAAPRGPAQPPLATGPQPPDLFVKAPSHFAVPMEKTPLPKVRTPLELRAPEHFEARNQFFDSLRNPRWGNPARTSILLDGVLDGIPMTFLASPLDPEPRGVEIWQEALAGRFGTIGPFVAPPPDPPPLKAIVVSHRQFFQALALTGRITQEEALAAVRTGTIPAEMQRFIDTLTPDEQFAAKMIISGAGEFDRYHPLTIKFGEFEGMTDQQLDALWELAASL